MSNTIITVGRQTGSGGHDIGKAIAEKLNIPFYDKNLLVRAAKESGLSEEIMEAMDEKGNSSFFYSVSGPSFGGFSLGSHAFSGQDVPLNQKVFLAYFETIRRIADEGPAVIVGRCADYILDGYAKSLNVFIYAPEEMRIENISKRFDGMTTDKAREHMQKTDKKRSSYYHFYTDKKWGNSAEYDLCIDSSSFGFKGTVDLIISAAEMI